MAEDKSRKSGFGASFRRMASGAIQRVSSLNLFSSSSQRNVTATESQQQPYVPPPTHGPAPDAKDAWNRFVKDPGTFMRRNNLTIGGHHQTSQTNKFTFASFGQALDERGERGQTRRSSVTGMDEPLHTYKLVPQTRYELTTPTEQKQHNSSIEVTLHNVHMDRAPGGQQTDLSNLHRTETDLVPGQQQRMATNALTHCLLMNQDGKVSHIQPSDVEGDTFGKGAQMHTAISEMAPNAQIFGKNDYAESPTRLDVFMKSSRRGSVHLYARSAFQDDGSGDSMSKESHSYFERYWPPSQTQKEQFEQNMQFLTPADQVRERKRQQESFGKGVKQDVVDKVQSMRGKIGMGRYAQKVAKSPVQDHEWDD